MRLNELSYPSSAFIARLKAMEDDKLAELASSMTVRQERLRMKFSRSRSVADSEAYRRCCAELGRVKTEIRLRS